MHIAIAGNIGSGKTTLTKMLAKRYGWIPRFEPVDNNPYLEDFYADMNRWSFNLQVYFLNKRFREVVEISKGNLIIIDGDTCKFEGCTESFQKITDQIDSALYGLFPLEEQKK